MKRTPLFNSHFLLAFLAVGFLLVLPRKGLPAPPISLQWKTHIFSSSFFGRNETATPCMDENNVYVGSENGKFYALERRRGKVRWTFKSSSPIRSQATAGNEKVFFGNQEGQLHALKASDGTLLWKKQLDSLTHAPSFLSQGVLYVQTLDDQILSLDAQTGKTLWNLKGPPQSEFSLLLPPGPVVNNNTLYLAFSQGTLVAAEKANGGIIWQRNLEKGDRPFRGILTPLISDKMVLVALIGKGIFALHPTKGTVLWQHDDPDIRSLAQSNPPGNGLFASNFAGKVYALDGANGKIRWQDQAAKNIKVSLGPVSVVGDWVFVGDTDSSIWARSAKSGQMKWHYNPWPSLTGFPNQLIWPLQCETSPNEPCFLAAWSQKGTLYFFELQL